MNLLSRNAYPLDSIKEGADEPVADDTCDVTYESNPGDMLHIPAEGNSAVPKTHERRCTYLMLP